MKKFFVSVLLCTAFLAAACPSALAEVAIETSVSRSSLPVGEQLVLDIIISNANGRIEKPDIGSLDGFTAYSQGHSQELSIVNGRSSSRSIFSYVLVANSEGHKTIGPFTVVIAGKEYKVAPVKVDVLKASYSSPGASGGAYTWTQTPVNSPSPRSLPGPQIGDQDIFVKAWLDKDEVYINEPAMLTYTLFTRMSATYKGFEKEPVTTGFWVEDFPPEKTIRRTEQFLNGQRYVVADVRKIALFPTQAGVFTIEPGVLSASVELRSEDSFQSFFSGNVFGSRAGFPNAFMTEVVPKTIVADSVRLSVKALPETGKTNAFSGAVGQYEIESSIDKNDVEVGDPVTLRVKISGRGNINTVESPKLPVMDGFKVYESSTSSNVSKERLMVEGEKITETVIVPKRPGAYEIPSMAFSFFDPKSGEYRTMKTEAHTLNVRGTIGEPESSSPRGDATQAVSEAGVEQVDKAEVDLVAKDIRFIKTTESKLFLESEDFYRTRWYWGLCLFWALLGVGFSYAASRKDQDSKDSKGARLRRSHSEARSKLKLSAKKMKDENHDEFYAEISKAVNGYFADKFGIPVHGVSQHRIEELAKEQITAELMNKINLLFDRMSRGRFAKGEKDSEEMRDVYDLADEVITSFEKVKLK